MCSVYSLCLVDTGSLELLQQPEKHGLELCWENQGPSWPCTQALCDPSPAPSDLICLILGSVPSHRCRYAGRHTIARGLVLVPLSLQSPCTGQRTHLICKVHGVSPPQGDSVTLTASSLIHRQELHSVTLTDTHFCTNADTHKIPESYMHINMNTHTHADIYPHQHAP